MNLTSDFLLPNLQMTGDEEIYERCQEKKTLSTVIKHAELLLVYKVRKLQVARNWENGLGKHYYNLWLWIICYHLRWSLGHQVWGFYVPSGHCKEMHVSDLKLPKVRQVAVLSSATLVLQFLEGCGHLETAFCSAHLYLKPVWEKVRWLIWS